MGDRSGAKGAYEEALGHYRALAEREPEGFTPDVAMTLNNLGNVLRDMGDRSGAKGAYEEALGHYRALAEREPEAFTQYVATTLSNLALVLFEEGAEAQARRHASEALVLAAQQKDLAQARELEASLQDFLAGPPTRDASATEAVRAAEERYGDRLRQARLGVHTSEDALLERLRWPAGVLCEAGRGELVVARDWASWTTIPLVSVKDDACGGGYLLKWGDKGLVIDPGLGFTTACRQLGINLQDLDAVVATHYHVDHTGDLPELATCFYEAKEAGLDRQAEFYLAPGPWQVYGTLLAAVPGVKHAQRLAAGGHAPWNGCELRAVRARHHELTDHTETAIGLRIEIPTADGPFSLGITSDTAWEEGLHLGEAYAGVDVLVMHIGGLYDAARGVRGRSPRTTSA